MKRIKEIRIQNFKAFQEEQIFEFGAKGKNVLVYGNNGSGKSSLFWALYTLLQSSIKNTVGVQKYFVDYEEGNQNTHQSLKNVFMEAGADAHIKMTSIDTETQHEETFTISHEVINTDVPLIQELNLASDFINYKLLHNFYRGSHKVEVNIWPVFERDIFPFLAEGAQNWLDDIIKTPTLDIPKGPGGRASHGAPKDNFIGKLDTLNAKIETLLADIQSTANKFLKDEFNSGEDKVRISLSFWKKFDWNLVKQEIWKDDHQHIRHEGLKISLSVEVKQDGENDEWKPITRIQSFLNEAQLTRIAIAIRIGALRTRPQNAQFKILVLDDMLISLDLSNRMDVIRIILNKERKESLNFFDEYQKIILTHDPGFYELIKRHTDDSDWKYMKLNSTDVISEAPELREDIGRVDKAMAFLVTGELDACGTELRKETESIVDKYLNGLNTASNGEFEPLMNKLNSALNKVREKNRVDFNRSVSSLGLSKDVIAKLETDFQSDDDLSPEQKGKLTSLRRYLIRYISSQIDFNSNSETIILEVKENLKRILNPSAHDSFDPLYAAELQSALDSVVQLKEALDREAQGEEEE